MLIQLNFDLSDVPSDKYEDIYEVLEEYGYSRTLEGDSGKIYTMPSTTLIKKADDDLKLSKEFKEIKEQIESAIPPKSSIKALYIFKLAGSWSGIPYKK